MRIKSMFLILFIYVLTTGCCPGINGTVVNAETGKPIEGAVVLVEWTKTKGLPGMPYTESYKVIEAVTDKEGNFRISGVYNPFIDPPYVTVYKKGYVAWNSRIIFPDYRNRTDFKWGKTYTFKLEHFKPEYSYIDHTAFLSSAINSSIGKKEMIEDAYYWEELEASKERDKKSK